MKSTQVANVQIKKSTIDALRVLSWNGINESDWNGTNDDDWILAARCEQRTAAMARRAKFQARDANNLFEPRMFTSLAEASEHLRLRTCELRELNAHLESRIRELRESREQTPTSPTSPTSSFNSAPETFDSNENTPQSGNSHSVVTPEVAMYCGALQFE
jgi:hypothetical protein